VEFRGWDVNASVADGAVHTTASRVGPGEKSHFVLQNSSILLEDFRLDGGKQSTLVNGTLSFARNADLSIETANARKSKGRSASDFENWTRAQNFRAARWPKISVEKAGCPAAGGLTIGLLMKWDSLGREGNDR